MRRADREITDPRRLDEIISRCDCCRLGLATEGAPYLVPMNFGYAREAGRPVFYFHCAPAGRKLDLIRANPQAGFELDTAHRLKEAGHACGYAYAYQSVIGYGHTEILTGTEEKRAALQRIMYRYTGRSDWAFEETALAATVVFKLTVEEMSGKEHL